MITVYVIKSTNKPFTYVGITSNLSKRLLSHNNGYNRSTKPYSPFELIYAEEYRNYTEAREREKYLKSQAGKVFLDKFLSDGSSLPG